MRTNDRIHRFRIRLRVLRSGTLPHLVPADAVRRLRRRGSSVAALVVLAATHTEFFDSVFVGNRATVLSAVAEDGTSSKLLNELQDGTGGLLAESWSAVGDPGVSPKPKHTRRATLAFWSIWWS